MEERNNKKRYKQYDVIVIAGTTEAREVIEEQLRENRTILASTATELGARMLRSYPVDVHVGRLDEEGFLQLFRDNPCKKVIDASHPFARVVTETARAAARKAGIPFERHEREELTYAYEGVISVADAAKAAEVLNTMEGKVLLTTGVNTAAVYSAHVRDGRNRLYIRVLDTPASYEGCRKAGYPDDHVFGEMPPFTLEDNLRLIRRIDAKALVTKDSGKTGGVDVKMEACRQAGIPCVLIRRPAQ